MRRVSPICSVVSAVFFGTRAATNATCECDTHYALREEGNHKAVAIRRCSLRSHPRCRTDPSGPQRQRGSVCTITALRPTMPGRVRSSIGLPRIDLAIGLRTVRAPWRRQPPCRRRIRFVRRPPSPVGILPNAAASALTERCIGGASLRCVVFRFGVNLVRVIWVQQCAEKLQLLQAQFFIFSPDCSPEVPNFPIIHASVATASKQASRTIGQPHCASGAPNVAEESRQFMVVLNSWVNTTDRPHEFRTTTNGCVGKPAHRQGSLPKKERHFLDKGGCARPQPPKYPFVFADSKLAGAGMTAAWRGDRRRSATGCLGGHSERSEKLSGAFYSRSSEIPRFAQNDTLIVLNATSSAETEFCGGRPCFAEHPSPRM